MTSYLSTSPGLWQVTARILSAVFAGSVVTMSATVLHGGSLLVAEKKSGSVTQPPANLTVAPSQQLPQVSWPVPGQVPLWPSAAAPPWVPPFNNLPMFPPPMLDSPHYRMPVAPEPIADPSPMQIDPGPPAAGPTTPKNPALRVLARPLIHNPARPSTEWWAGSFRARRGSRAEPLHGGQQPRRGRFRAADCLQFPV
jgi:hypothetical protein